jgi:hypothetical protein
MHDTEPKHDRRAAASCDRQHALAIAAINEMFDKVDELTVAHARRRRPAPTQGSWNGGRTPPGLDLAPAARVVTRLCGAASGPI